VLLDKDGLEVAMEQYLLHIHQVVVAVQEA
jgi:hypothetical protein